MEGPKIISTAQNEEKSVVDSAFCVRETVSGVLWAGSLATALDQGRICWAVRRLADLEDQLGLEGKGLDFGGEDGLRAAAQARYESCLLQGERQAADSLRIAFGKYFVLGMPIGCRGGRPLQLTNLK